VLKVKFLQNGPRIPVWGIKKLPTGAPRTEKRCRTQGGVWGGFTKLAGRHFVDGVQLGKTCGGVAANPLNRAYRHATTVPRQASLPQRRLHQKKGKVWNLRQSHGRDTRRPPAQRVLRKEARGGQHRRLLPRRNKHKKKKKKKQTSPSEKGSGKSWRPKTRRVRLGPDKTVQNR